MISFLIGMAWKSALIAGAALLLLRLLKNSPAAARAALLRFAALLLLLLPALSMLLPTLEVALLPALEVALPQPDASVIVPTSSSVAASGALTAASAIEAPAIATGPSAADLFLLAYAAGVAALLARLGIGIMRLAAWTRAASAPDCARWTSAFARVCARSGARRRARLLVSRQVAAPMSWGWRSAAILIDRGSLERPEDAPAVLEHEMAHVARGDWTALMLVRLATALFWFNPLVWLLGRAFVQCAEEAADAKAIGQVAPADYALMLLSYATQGGRAAVPANPIASHPIAARIEAILSRRVAAGRYGWKVGAAMAGCLAVAAPVAALSIERMAAPAAPVPPAPPAAAALAALQPAEVPEAPEPPEQPEAPEAPEAPVAPQAPRAPAAPEPMFDEGAFDRSIAEAVKEAERAARMAEAEVEKARVQIAKIDPEALRESALRAAAAGMESGAQGLEEGARSMAEESRRLRNDPDYRKRARLRWSEEGRDMTDKEALELARKLEEGAAKLREGAEQMRRKTAEMRAERQ